MLSAAVQQAMRIRYPRASKIAHRLADRLEFELGAQGWPQGSVIGPEIDMARQYGASQRAMRQALRILEWRDLGTIRRGGKGGLVLRIPSWADTGRLFANHLLAWGETRSDVENSYALLGAEFNAASQQARDVVQQFFDEILSSMESAPAATGSRAAVIARDIISTGHIPAGTSAKTIDALMDQYSVGRPIIVQALRLLEEQELVAAARGRSGGLIPARPSGGAIVKAARSHLIARDLDMRVTGEIIWMILRASAANLATAPDPDDMELKALQAEILPRLVRDGDLSIQLAIYIHIVESTRAVTLRRIGQCFWGYNLDRLHMMIALPRSLPHRIRVSLADALADLITGLLDGDPVRTEAALLGCSEANAAIARSMQD